MEMKDMPGKQVPKVGYAYVRKQEMEMTYPPEKALQVGTIFPQLDISTGEYERGLYNGRH